MQNKQQLIEEFKQNTNIIDVLESHGSKVKNNKTLCLFHEEKDPSMVIFPRTNKFKCFACGVHGDVIDLIQHIEGKTLDEVIGYNLNDNASKIEAYLKEKFSTREKDGELYRFNRIHFYHSESCDLVSVKIIYKNADKSKKTALQLNVENNRKISKGFVNHTYLYNLPYLIIAKNKSKDIYIVEGEKDADNLKKLGFTATTTRDGSNSWKEEYNKYLKDCNIVVIGDNDKSGRDYVDKLKHEILAISKSFKIIDLPGLRDKEDITDWINYGHTQEELKKLVEKSMDIKLQADIKKHDFSNKGILDRFTYLNREIVQYVNEIGQFIYWSGEKWFLEDDKRLGKVANEFLYKLIYDTSRYIQCLKLLENNEESEIFIKITNNLKKLTPVKIIKENYINMNIWIPKNNLDKDIDILNCQNGILNLNTGELSPHYPKKYCTKITNVAYDPAATCPSFINSLEWIFPNQDTRREFQKAYGYSIGGSMEYQVWFILLGKGENGKSTAMDPLRDLMGDYYASLNAKSLEPRNDNTAPSSDMAKLVGTRVVIASEPSQKQKLDDGLLKTYAVGEDVNARFLRQNEFTFNPQFKLWVPTNTLPLISNTEHGFWRRIIIFPCRNKPKNKIFDFYKKFIKPNEIPGILNWALKGRKMLMEEGFKPTIEMLEALQEYKIKVNPVEEFITQCCVKNNEKKTQTSYLLQAFNVWALDEGHTELKIRTFRDRLVDMGYDVKKASQNKSYVFGLDIKNGLDFRNQYTYIQSLKEIQKEEAKSKISVI
jgi:putative DNA primase/helicase